MAFTTQHSTYSKCRRLGQLLREYCCCCVQQQATPPDRPTAMPRLKTLQHTDKWVVTTHIPHQYICSLNAAVSFISPAAPLALSHIVVRTAGCHHRTCAMFVYTRTTIIYENVARYLRIAQSHLLKQRLACIFSFIAKTLVWIWCYSTILLKSCLRLDEKGKDKRERDEFSYIFAKQSNMTPMLKAKTINRH